MWKRKEQEINQKNRNYFSFFFYLISSDDNHQNEPKKKENKNPETTSPPSQGRQADKISKTWTKFSPVGRTHMTPVIVIHFRLHTEVQASVSSS